MITLPHSLFRHQRHIRQTPWVPSVPRPPPLGNIQLSCELSCVGWLLASTDIPRFDGAISARHIPHPTRLFNMEATFDDHHSHMEKLRAEEPPQHFHYLQVEYIKVLEGELDVDVGDKRIRLTPSDDELEIPAWCRNRLIPLPPSDDRKYTKFLLSGPGAEGPYMLDAIFYENYYRYMDHALSPGGDGISLIQVLCVSRPSHKITAVVMHSI